VDKGHAACSLSLRGAEMQIGGSRKLLFATTALAS
jgi:hypothetical protein